MTPLPFLVLAHATPPPTPDAVRWQHRLIVLVADDPEEVRVHTSLEDIGSRPAEVADRKLQVVTVLGGAVVGLDATAEGLAHRWDLSPDGGFEGLLVGLDGTVKARTDAAVDLDRWFAHIDTMPMRRAELEERSP